MIATPSAPRIAVHSTSRPAGYHSSAAGGVVVGMRRIGRPRQHREIAEPPGRRADTEHERDREAPVDRDAKADRGDASGDQAGEGAPADGGDEDRERGDIKQNDRQRRAGYDRGEQQRGSRARADTDQYRPATSSAVPLQKRLEADRFVRPNHGFTDHAYIRTDRCLVARTSTSRVPDIADVGSCRSYRIT